MFDDVRCEAALPEPEPMDGNFQTKDTPAQYCDLYVIKKDGTLWHQTYDFEDKSDPNAEGHMRFAGCMTRVNKKLERVEFHGMMNFYGNTAQTGRWKEYRAKFTDGKMVDVEVVRGIYGK